MYNVYLHRAITVITLTGRLHGVMQFIDAFSITVNGKKIQKKVILQVIPG